MRSILMGSSRLIAHVLVVNSSPTSMSMFAIKFSKKKSKKEKISDKDKNNKSVEEDQVQSLTSDEGGSTTTSKHL